MPPLHETPALAPLVTHSPWALRFKEICESNGITTWLPDLEWMQQQAAVPSPLDEAAIAREIERLECSHGAERIDRAPTREDIHARWRWCYGTDAPDPHTTPLKQCESYPPMPLAWFAHDTACKRLRDPDPQHLFLDWMAARYLAGYSPKLSGADVFWVFTNGVQTETERSLFYEMLTGADGSDYPLMRIEGGLSVRDIARGTLESGTRVGELSWWLNQWAEMPADWPVNRPLPPVIDGGFWPHRHKDGEFWPTGESRG